MPGFPPAQAIDVGVGESYRQQKFEAWGTSLAWFGNALGIWQSESAHAEVMELLFDGPNNLGLNYARYNIGGGQNRLLVRNFRPGAAVPGWVPSAPSSITDTSTWQWNWDADPGQRRTLAEAIGRSVNRVDAVSYSAPYWMTNSLDTAGAIGGGDNLATQYYDEFAYYQAEVLLHFRDQLGVHIGTFNPMNEPNASWWQAGGQQEGMHVSQGSNQRLLIQAVAEALMARGLEIGIAAADEFSANSSLSAFNQFNATTLSYIKQINTHVYGGSGSNSPASMQSLRALADAQDISLYQSEYGNNSTTGLQGGIGLANRITSDVNVMGVNGWTYWQAVEPVSLSGSGWGLLWADYGINGELSEIRPQYHVMRQFTSYIRPGASILSTSDPETVAAYHPDSETTALVFTNDESTSDVNVYDLLDQTAAYTRMIRTDGLGNFLSLGPADVNGNQITIDSPGTAVTTVVIHHKPNLIENANFGNAGMAWRIAGKASYDEAVDNTQDGSAAVLLSSDSVVKSAAVWQEGIGHPLTDLTGRAYEFSADLLFQNDNSQYDANARIGLEFYGADGQVLTHDSPLDFAEAVNPMLQDSEYRVFRSAIVQAPAGTRFVRPVVRVDNVAPGGSGSVFVDNAYLQEIRFVPRARAWRDDADGAWSSAANWQDDASVANNRRSYLGPHITAARTITVDVDSVTTGVTLDSELSYRLSGDATLTIGDGASDARLDVRAGNHAIQAPTRLGSDVEIQVVGDAALSIDEALDLNGRRLRKTGPGLLELPNGLVMAGGTLVVEAGVVPSIVIGGNGVLDGTLEVIVPPGQRADWGHLYTVAKFSTPGLSFGNLELPELDDDWLAWEMRTPAGRHLTAEVVNRVDFNRDDAVGEEDLTVWSNGFGADSQGDADADGETGGSDFLVWQRARGQKATANTLTLIVDPISGDAQLANRTGIDLAIDAYTISSDTGSLLTSWDSLEDQGVSGWTEALPVAGRLSELNPTGALALAADSTLGLAGLYNTAGGFQDLRLQFRETTLGTIHGRVLYAALATSASPIAVPEPSCIVLITLWALPWFNGRQAFGRWAA
jgi:hypothetical protein